MAALRKAVRTAGEILCPSLWRKLVACRRKRTSRRHWDERTKDVLACPDNARLTRVADAGKVVDGYQIMHNGIKVVVDGYYGDGITRMLTANRGCHEPQEEVIFEAVLRELPSGSTMLEAGAYWGFYSMWFCQAVKQPKVFLIEPDRANLVVGQRNFALNHCSGNFTHAYIGDRPGSHPDGTSVVSVESFLADQGLSQLAVLHADVQGFEVQMLRGARHLLEARCLDYLFLSTHSGKLHGQCAQFLRESGYRVLVSLDLEESYSVDGLLVACSPSVQPPAMAHPSRKLRQR